jgi:hypothetical protein
MSPRLAFAVVAALLLPPLTARADRPRVEARAGLDAPLGNYSGALVFQPGEVLAIGAGAGVATGEPNGAQLQVGAFARANLLRRERFSLGPVLTLSVGRRTSTETHHRSGTVYDEAIEYRWKPGVRLDLGIGGELALARFSFRLEAGLGYYLSSPECVYGEAGTNPSFWGDCDSPSVPEYFQHSVEPGRLAPYVSLAVGYDLEPGRGSGVASAAPPPVAATDNAWLAQTALTAPAGSITAALYEGVLARVTVGLTDRLQLWGGSSWTNFVDAPLWEAGAKLRVVSVGRFHVALGAEHVQVKLSASYRLSLTGGGVVTSACLDEACASVVSLGVAAGRYFNEEDTVQRTEAGFLVSPNAVLAVSRPVKVVVETHLPATAPGRGLWALLARFSIKALSFDLGLMGTYEDQRILPAGTIAYRW